MGGKVSVASGVFRRGVRGQRAGGERERDGRRWVGDGNASTRSLPAGRETTHRDTALQDLALRSSSLQDVCNQESLPVTRAESREEGRVAGDEWKLPRPHHSSGETGQMIVEPTPELLITSTWEANSKSERIPPTEAGKSPILPAQIAATEFCSSSAKNDEAGNAALRRAWRGRDGVEVAKEDGDDTEQFAIRPSCCSSSSPPPSRGSRTACSRTAASSSFSSSIRESEHSRREAEREGQRRISNSQLSASSSCIDHLTSDTTAAKQDHPPSALKVSSPPSCPRCLALI